ncbi:glycine cleavage T C-terminal barrel domain-containing protein [Nocardiopsis halophila]|uniref:glycine cleavage T C-terminal barrel domain-containing protein n=1 Tax=Nocardiopsis halophila TaxID=141692 RepID=UPI0023AA1AEA|nr:glycine cleavage T C-terminal barrel domain-containing protein [Nocardiopsis halophila]
MGFAMVPIGLASLGTELAVHRPGGQVPAVVVDKPFVDPKKMLPKQDLRRLAATS